MRFLGLAWPPFIFWGCPSLVCGVGLAPFIFWGWVAPLRFLGLVWPPSFFGVGLPPFQFLGLASGPLGTLQTASAQRFPCRACNGLRTTLSVVLALAQALRTLMRQRGTEPVTLEARPVGMRGGALSMRRGRPEVDMQAADPSLKRPQGKLSRATF